MRFLPHFSPDASPELHSNFINYLFDIGWWGLYAGATMAFLTIYAARIGATPQQIGLFSALPAGITLLLSLPAAPLIRRLSAHRATFIGAFVARLLFFSYVLLPFLFDGNNPGQVDAILFIAIILTIPNTLVGIGFNQLFIESIPPDWRGTVVGTRNAVFAVISFVVTLISGQILTHMPFPQGYQVVFVIGAVGGVMTSFHLARVHPGVGLQDPPNGVPGAPAADLRGSAPAVPTARPTPVFRAAGLPLFRARVAAPIRRLLPAIDAPARRYMRVLALLFLFGIVNNMVAPLVPEVLVHALHLSDAWISIGTAATNLLYFIISLFMIRIIRRTGNRTGTALGAVLLGLQAIVLAFATEPAHYLLSTVISGLGTGMLNTAQFNYNLENVPANERSAWLSWNLLLGNAALLLGALAGPQLGQVIGVGQGLAVFGVLRVLMAVLIWRMG